MFKFATAKEINPKKPFYFFETFSNIFFVAIGGIFAHLFLIFFVFGIVDPSPYNVKFCLFSFFGALFFVVSRFRFVKRYSHILRNLNYENFLNSRKQLFFWIIWTFNAYLIFCWFFLIILGSTNGFNITIGSSSMGDSNTKILGFVLLLIHLFLLFLFKFVTHYWTSLISFAHLEFEKRRKNLEIVRSKAGLEK